MPKLSHKEVDDRIAAILEPKKQPTNGREVFQRLMSRMKGEPNAQR